MSQDTEGEGPDPSGPPNTRAEPAQPVLGDAAIARRLGPLMLAAALGLVPFTVFSTFLVDIATEAGRDPVSIGSLRGLGGLSAMLVGALYVPLADRVRHGLAAAIALVLLALGSGLMLVSGRWAIIAFCLVIGAATAVLSPALQAEAATRFSGEAEQGRAVTMMTATTTLTAALAGPVLGAVSLLGGWRTILMATAALALLTAIDTTSRSRRVQHPVGRDEDAARGLGESEGSSAAQGEKAPARSLGWSRLLCRVDLLALIGISALRTAAFMGALAVVAAAYADRHSITGAAFTLVWTVSGVSFFAANWWSGRRLAREAATGRMLAAGLAGVVLVFATEPLPLMITGTALLAAGHALIAASATTLIVRRAGRLRGRALAMAGTGQSVGTFAGAWIAGAAYAVGGWLGCAAALVLLTLCAGLLMIPALRVEPDRRS